MEVRSQPASQSVSQGWEEVGEGRKESENPQRVRKSVSISIEICIRNL